jgi:hypothetical protein
VEAVGFVGGAAEFVADIVPEDASMCCALVDGALNRDLR